MLYQLLFSLHDQVSWLKWLNVLRYTSTRILAATLTALLLSLVLYPWFIRTLQKIQLGQVVRDDGPESHFSKRGTPTMGGSLILFTLIIPTVMWADMSNPFILLATAITAGSRSSTAAATCRSDAPSSTSAAAVRTSRSCCMRS